MELIVSPITIKTQNKIYQDISYAALANSTIGKIYKTYREYYRKSGPNQMTHKLGPKDSMISKGKLWIKRLRK